MTIQITKPEVEAVINNVSSPGRSRMPRMLFGRLFNPRQRKPQPSLRQARRKAWLSSLPHSEASISILKVTRAGISTCDRLSGRYEHPIRADAR
jgi:hypothetical protein